VELLYFPRPADLRKWFVKNHDKETELLIGFYKKGTGKASVDWEQSVEEALCFGWIDGVRRSLGPEAFCIRFTHRKPGSNWSAINIRKIGELNAAGKMHKNGLAAFGKRKENRSAIYAYENKPKKLNPAADKKFRANQSAWRFFRSQAPSYQRTAIYWVMQAKQEKTRGKRLETLINDSEASLRIIHLRPYPRKD
jgi:uncharacterized protein YdeI (YjbR/CyaY-like superfamily)